MLQQTKFGLEALFGMRIKTFGHRKKFEQRSLFLMNHICHFDWLFFWGVAKRNGNIATWKVVTKDAVRRVPLIGICMQYACHIFISRRWEADEREFRKKLFYYNALDLPTQLLIFPEGGDFTEKSKAKSDAYADTNGLKRYEYCLHPRAKGFVYVMEALRSGRLDAVYDMTIGYPDALAKTEADFAGGKYIPREIHFNIRHYRAEDLPTDEEGLTQWLTERWKEKEKSLKLFYTHKRFVETTDTGFRNGMATNQKNGHMEYRPVAETVLPKPYAFTFSGLAFYTMLMVVFTYLFLYLHWAWRCCVAGMVVFTFVKGLRGGIDTILPDIVRDRIEAAYNKHHRNREALTEESRTTTNKTF
jgi:lysocardiolipin and lysophospholipid acyltransferase